MAYFFLILPLLHGKYDFLMAAQYSILWNIFNQFPIYVLPKSRIQGWETGSCLEEVLANHGFSTLSDKTTSQSQDIFC